MNRTMESITLMCGLAATTVWVISDVAAGQPQSQTGQTRTLDVQSGRPLADAIRELERRHGWVVTYEEVPYEYSGDLVDVARSVRKDGDFTKPVLVPKGGRLSFAYSEPLPNGENEEAVLLELLRQYRASGLPGEFRLARTGRVFHVTPWTSRNALGVEVERQSALDARISIPEGDRTVDEMLTAIELAIYTETGWPIAVGGPVLGGVNYFCRSCCLKSESYRTSSESLLPSHAAAAHPSWD